MPLDYDDPYVAIGCTIKGVTAKAVKIDPDSGEQLWVPRSVIHGAEERLLDGSVGDPMELRVRRWFAEKEGLV